MNIQTLPSNTLHTSFSVSSLYQGEFRDKLVFSWVGSSKYPALKNSWESFLSQEEAWYFQGLKFSKRQKSYLMGRYAGKLALSQYFNECDLKSISIQAGVLCQPVVNYSSKQPIDVSISHIEQGAVAIAFPLHHPSGIDIEAIDERKHETILSQMTEIELSRMSVISREQIIDLTVHWTAKEALSKVLKCGLTCPMTLLSLSTYKRKENYAFGEFENFRQYRFESWINTEKVCSIVIPKYSRSDINLRKVNW